MFNESDEVQIAGPPGMLIAAREYVLLDNAIEVLVRPGDLCFDVGAFRLIGEVPVYSVSTSGEAGFSSETYDSTFADWPQPDILKISGCNVCEALLGADSYLKNGRRGHLIFIHDNRYVPANESHNAALLHDRISQSGRRIFSVQDFLLRRDPLSVQQFDKLIAIGRKIFIAC